MSKYLLVGSYPTDCKLLEATGIMSMKATFFRVGIPLKTCVIDAKSKRYNQKHEEFPSIQQFFFSPISNKTSLFQAFEPNNEAVFIPKENFWLDFTLMGVGQLPQDQKLETQETTNLTFFHT